MYDPCDPYLEPGGLEPIISDLDQPPSMIIPGEASLPKMLEETADGKGSGVQFSAKKYVVNKIVISALYNSLFSDKNSMCSTFILSQV